MVFQARAMRGTRAECANVLTRSICKLEGTDRKHEMRHERSELEGVVIVNVFNEYTVEYPTSHLYFLVIHTSLQPGVYT